ncbi:MAG TPA: hypothetical protein VGN32_11070 [Ktedonobacterales bacterium]|nr:hypothetical protein [Ktedonobacterales bacterium]
MHSRVRLILLVCTLVAVLAACAGSAGGATDSSGAFPSTANHPQPQEETFQGCPPGGDGGDHDLNMLKNRIDNGDNGQFQDVALSDLLQLTWPQSVERAQRANWSSGDLATIQQTEGVAIRTTGYLVGVRHEGTESTNCHSTDYRDFHMWLVVNSTDTRASSMVVEVAPRVRDMRPGWDDSTLMGLVGQQVRISGWLMFDQEHPEQLGKTRATLWEIHPIIHIEVNQGGGWTSIDG